MGNPEVATVKEGLSLGLTVLFALYLCTKDFGKYSLSLDIHGYVMFRAIVVSKLFQTTICRIYLVSGTFVKVNGHFVYSIQHQFKRIRKKVIIKILDIRCPQHFCCIQSVES